MKIDEQKALGLIDLILQHWLPAGHGIMHTCRSMALPHTATIYLLVFDSEIVYIGQTGDLKVRTAQHNANPRMAGTAWDTIYWFQPGIPDQSTRLQLEAMLICGCLPIRNRALMLVKNKLGRFSEVRWSDRGKMGALISAAEKLNLSYPPTP